MLRKISDPRTVAFIWKVFDIYKQDFKITYMSENILVGDPEGSIKWLQNRLQMHRHPQED